MQDSYLVLNLSGTEPEHDFAFACAHDFVTDLNELHQQLDNTLPMLNVNTKLPLIPDNYQLWNSRLEVL